MSSRKMTKDELEKQIEEWIRDGILAQRDEVDPTKRELKRKWTKDKLEEMIENGKYFINEWEEIYSNI